MFNIHEPFEKYQQQQRKYRRNWQMKNHGRNFTERKIFLSGAEISNLYQTKPVNLYHIFASQLHYSGTIML